MQIILPFKGSVEKYLTAEFQHAVPAPTRCPHCGFNRRLLALGYYCRGVNAIDSSRVLVIAVRRFRCRACGRTVSLLPSFVQPYRLVRTIAVERFFSGHEYDRDFVRWKPLLRRYWRRFEAWVPDLLASIGHVLGLSPPTAKAFDVWASLIAIWGSLAATTVHLVSEYRVTIWGKYRCHQSSLPNSDS